MIKREVSLPTTLEGQIHRLLLSDFEIDIHNPRDQKNLAQDIRRMSDFYADQPFGRTPWEEPWCQRAQLTYFLPLNTCRILQVLEEGQRLGFFAGLSSILDFGAGLGAFHAAYDQRFATDRSTSVTEVEAHPSARALRHRLSPSSSLKLFSKMDENVPRADLLVCSYSLTELRERASFLHHFSNLLIVEPSTREDSRRLSQLRGELVKAGFFIWAPCTHQQECPLLRHSESDWCHDRVHFKMPAWMESIESHLPMKNRTLTWSFLFASRREPPDLSAWARLTGDVRLEKGKTRQMFCRGPEREFLAWMTRDGKAPELPRGELIQIPEGEKKSNELRVRREILLYPS